MDIETPELTKRKMAEYREDPVLFLEEQYICKNALTGEVELVKLEEWQKEIVREMLSVDPDTGLRRYTMAVIGLAKKNGKSELGAMLGVWFAFCDEKDGEIIVAANDKEQASNVTFKRMQQAIGRNERLKAKARITKYRIVVNDSTEIRAVPCDAEGEAGNMASLTLFDELWGQRDAAFFHELTLNPVRRQPMAIVTTYAGYDRESLLHYLYERGRKGDDPKLYFHWLEGRKAANPASWVTDDYLNQQEARLPPQVFKRLHCNEWSSPDEPFVTAEQVDACTTGSPSLRREPRHAYVLTCDLGLTRDRAAVAVLHRDYDRDKLLLDHLQVWEGSQSEPVRIADVAGRLEELFRLYRPRWVVMDAWEMRAFIQAHEHWPIEEFRFAGAPMHQMAQVLYESIINRRLVLYPDAGRFEGRDGLFHTLQTELPSLILVESTEGYRFDHRTGKHNDMSVAVGMGAWRLMQRPDGQPKWRKMLAAQIAIEGDAALSTDAQWARCARDEGEHVVDVHGQPFDLYNRGVRRRGPDGGWGVFYGPY